MLFALHGFAVHGLSEPTTGGPRGDRGTRGRPHRGRARRRQEHAGGRAAVVRTGNRLPRHTGPASPITHLGGRARPPDCSRSSVTRCHHARIGINSSSTCAFSGIDGITAASRLNAPPVWRGKHCWRRKRGSARSFSPTSYSIDVPGWELKPGSAPPAAGCTPTHPGAGQQCQPEAAWRHLRRRSNPLCADTEL